ncbi:hypothetical protein [Sporosarcina psychrophila]|uniref:hypothetical protein n=1 Tax=Sporosarcina psychrophila TaxID=1476 RepID=UPI0012E709FC|nr:hypothetical protein [Sporosarcina psychrophila]
MAYDRFAYGFAREVMAYDRFAYGFAREVMAYDRFAYGFAREQWYMIALLTDMLGSNGI